MEMAVGMQRNIGGKMYKIFKYFFVVVSIVGSLLSIVDFLFGFIPLTSTQKLMILGAFVALGIMSCILPKEEAAEVRMGRSVVVMFLAGLAIILLINAFSGTTPPPPGNGDTPTVTDSPSNTPIDHATVPPVIDSGNDYSAETVTAFTTGYTYYENGQFDLAFPLIMQSAMDGYPEGELYVGCCYRDGKGVEQDAEAAFDWFSIAASHGNAQAQYNLGYCYYRGDGVRTNDTLAFKWFLKSAEQSNRYGLLWTGFCYHKGIGVAQDYDLAQFYYESAKLAGNQDAVDRLAELMQDRGY